MVPVLYKQAKHLIVKNLASGIYCIIFVLILKCVSDADN